MAANGPALCRERGQPTAEGPGWRQAEVALGQRLCVQNQLRLSPGKRKAHFNMLTDAEVAAVEQTVADACRGDASVSKHG